MAPPYATVDDYTLLTGIAVPPEDEPRIEAGLDQASSLIASYLGDNEAQVFATAPESLRNMTVARVRYKHLVPLGIRSESIGATSVTYSTPLNPFLLSAQEGDSLDGLIDSVVRGFSGGPAYSFVTPLG